MTWMRMFTLAPWTIVPVKTENCLRLSVHRQTRRVLRAVPLVGRMNVAPLLSQMRAIRPGVTPPTILQVAVRISLGRHLPGDLSERHSRSTD